MEKLTGTAMQRDLRFQAGRLPESLSQTGGSPLDGEPAPIGAAHAVSSDPVNSTTAKIIDSYALSPLQQGMLFHHLEASDSGVDIEQVTCALDEVVERDAFRSAWQAVFKRHTILRTSFRWQDAGEPRQDVHEQATVEMAQIDWSGVSAELQEERWLGLLAADRRRGFDLRIMPLLRLTLVQLAQNRFRLLWTFHHMLLDGRSFPILLREVFEVYQAIRDGKQVVFPETRPYREYIN